jgi:hypothetical protein
VRANCRPWLCREKSRRRSRPCPGVGSPVPPGERFRRTVLAAMPDIEAMELVDRVFEIGAEVVGTPYPIGIFLAAAGSVSESGSSRPASGLGHRPEGRATQWP